MKSHRKVELDARIAAELGLDVKQVRDITQAFVDQIRGSLADMEEVVLQGFGRFRMIKGEGVEKTILTQTPKGHPKRKRSLRVNRKFRVSFAKADAFNRLLREKHGPATEEIPNGKVRRR